MKSRLLLFLLLLPQLIFAEGSNEIWIDQAGHKTILYLCSDVIGHCGSGNSERNNFAVYDCDTDERLYFNIDNNDEIVYFGLNGSDQGSFADHYVVYRIKDEFGTIVYAESNVPTPSGAGFINNITEARIGPLQIVGAGGYDALTFTPPSPGLYYIEFARVNNLSGNYDPGIFYIELFDITVYNTVLSEIEPGRLYSQSWQFWDADPGDSNFQDNSATFYIYSNDSIITSLTYDEMEGRAWSMYCNQFGCQNTGNFVIDRMSLDEQQVFVPEYRIFVNPPDTLIYPPSTTTGKVIAPWPWAQENCDGTMTFYVTVDKAGNVDILLDFDPPFVDRNLQTIVSKGENLIFWDGLDGVGAPVYNSTNINFTITYINGLTNLPLYDIEYNENGFSIGLYTPAGNTPLVYWDDSNIEEPPGNPIGSVNLTGCNSTPPNPGCHDWSNIDIGNLNTINTWWYSASDTTLPIPIEEWRYPGALIFNQPPQSYCAGEQDVPISVTFDWNTDTYNFSYTGTGATINQDNPIDNFITIDFDLLATAGNIEVYGSNTNCGDGPVSTLAVTIAPLPGAVINATPNDTVCLNETVFFFGIDTNSLTIQTWVWDFGDGNTALGQNQTHVYTTTTNTIVSLVIITIHGCRDTAYFPISVVNPTIGFSISPNPACIVDTVFFTGSGDATFTGWFWDFGDGTNGTGKNVWHVYNTPGTKTVRLDVCNKSVIHDVEIIPRAISDAGVMESICETRPYDFALAPVPATAMDYQSLEWLSSGPGTFDNATWLHPVYTPAVGEFGITTFTLIAYAFDPCSNDTSYVQLTIFDGPEADFTITPGDSICVNEWVNLDATSSTTINLWAWDFGDGNTGTGQNTGYAWSGPGFYDITLVVTNTDGCLDTVIYLIEVFELPVAGFTVTPGLSICRTEEFIFNGTSTTNIENWYWDLGDGTTANTQNVSHTYAAANTYDVSLYVYNENSCRDTITQQVTVFELPVCDFTISPNDTSCVNELVTFNGTGTPDIVTWDWDFGDGNTGIGAVVNHTYISTGIFNISLVVTNINGCLDTMIHQRVVVQPVIDFTMSLSPTCEGYVVNFTGSGIYGFSNYVWDFGDGGNAIGKNTSYIFTTPNTYTVTLTFCTSQVQHDILVNPLPLAFAGQDTASCEDVPFDLSTMPLPPSASDYSSIFWYGGLGTFDDPFTIGPVYTPAPGELGFVTLYMIAYGISPCHNDTSSMTIEIIIGAYAFAGSDEDHCQDLPFDFANCAQPPAAYNEIFRMWSSDGAGTFVDPTVEVPVYIPAAGETGIINFTFIASNILNCDSIDYMVLTIHPAFFESFNDSICFGDSLLLPGGGWAYGTGTYYDTLSSVWICDSVIETKLYMWPQIDANFTITPGDSSCFDDVVSFTRTGTSTLVSWLWDFGDGSFSTAINPSHVYASPGTYNVMFTFTDDIGCQDTVIQQVFVFQHPDVDFNASVSSACQYSELTFFGFSADDILLWEWDFGDGSFGTGQNIAHIYTLYGAMSVTLTVTATNGCASSMTKIMFVAAPPTADFTYNIIQCDTIQFTDLSTCPPGYFIVEWDWDFDDGTTSNLQHPAHVFPSGGTYQVSLLVYTDSAGMICVDSITKPVLVPDLPTVYFTWTPEPTCLGEITTFFGTSGNFIQEWYWDFDDGNFATIQNPEHTFAAAGTYNVMLFATDANGCRDTVSHLVSVLELPDVSFTVDPNPTCAGEQTSFTGISASTAGTWLWDFGDGGSAIVQNPIHVFASPGTYLVTLYVSDTNNCFNHATQTVVVNPMPLADFTHSAPACSGDTIFFYNLSSSPNGSIMQWTWDFGDGNTVTINAPDDPDVFHLYASGGTYDVTLTVVDQDSCSDSAIRPVSVSAGPIADFNYVGNCSGQPVEFTDISSPNGGSPIVSWFWEFDDPASGLMNTSNLQNPTHLFTTSGTFDVLLQVTNVEGCLSEVILPVDVDMAPQVSFTTDGDSACIDMEVQFFGQASTAVTWSWDFGDGGTSVLQDPVHVYSAAGIYYVTLVVEDGNGCSNSFTAPVFINPLPMAGFTFSSLPCSGSPVEFIDISAPMNAYMLSWHWYFGDGSDTIILAPGPGDVSHLYATPGNYTVSLAIQNSNSCEDSISYVIDVIQGPEAAFEYSGDICQGGSVQFTDLSQGFGYVIQGWLWQFGDPASGINNTSALQNPTHIFSSSGMYNVSLLVTSSTGCQHAVVQSVDIAPPPGVDWYVSPDTTCFSELTHFFTDPDSTLISEVVSYAWNFGDPASGINDTSNLQDPVHMYTAAGVYMVTLTIVNIDGCENTQLHSLEIRPPPVADFIHEQGCLGDSTLFTDMSISASGSISSWLWNFGDPASGVLNTSTLQDPGHVFTGLGTYNVELIATDYFGCSDTIIKTLVVDFAPTAFFTSNQPCDPPGVIYFSDSSFIQTGAAPIVEWLWELEPGYFSSEINPVYTYSKYDTCYVVSLTVTDANGCESLHADPVCVDAPLEADFSAMRVCNGVSSFFDGQYLPAGDSIISWTWDFDDGSVVAGDTDTISHLYAQPGTYYVTLTIENDKGCERSILHEVIVDALPAVDFAFSAAICDEPTYFTDLTDPGYGAVVQSWLWDFGDVASGINNTSDEQNPSHIYSSTDSTYFVSLIVTNSHGCTDSTGQIVDKGLCMQAIFEVSGDNQCNNTEVCFTDSSYILGDNHAIHGWQWSFGDGQVLSYDNYLDSVCHTYQQWGEYMVTLVITSVIDGTLYSDTMQKLISVSAVPEAGMAFQLPCAEAGTQFFDISATHGVDITSWRWDFGDPLNASDTSSLKDPVYVYPEAGTYTVELIVRNENACTDTIRMDVSIFNNPLAGFSSSLACAGGMTLFTDESIAAEGELSYWLWSFGTGETSGEQDPFYVYPDSGNYVVEMVVTDINQCRDTAINMLSVFPVPLSLFDIVNNYENVQGQILLDNYSENAVRYEWDYGNGDGSEINSPVVRYENNGTYLIQLIAWNNNNCPDTAYMEYSILFQGLYVPTGFTPDSKNEVLKLFKPVGVNLEVYQLTVINQRGNIVFSSDKLDENGTPVQGWDGTTNGEPMPPGTYMWTIAARFRDGRIWNGTDAGDGNTNTYGMVLLIR